MDTCRKKRRKENQPNYAPRKGWSHVNQQRSRYQNPQNQDHQEENYHPIFNGGGGGNGGNIANITEHLAFPTERVAHDPYLWSVDSSCNVYLTHCKRRLFNYKSYPTADRVEGIKGEFCDVLGAGSIRLEDSNGTGHTIHKALYAPDSKRSLLSYAKLMRDHEFEIQFVKRFDPNNFSLTSVKSGIKLPGRTINDLFHVWEPKSAQVALVTTRNSAKRPHEDDVERSENPSPKSPDLQPIGMHEFENTQPITAPESNTIPISPDNQQGSTSLHHPTSSNPVLTDQSINDFHLWHRRLGHAALLRTLRNLGFVTNAYKRQSFCEACAFVKQTRLPYRLYQHTAPRRLWRVHSDMSDIQRLSIDGKQYYITFIDDYSRYCWVYFTERKDAKTIRDIYENWRADAENKSGERVSYLQTDVGGQYQKEMGVILRSSGVTHLPSPPHSHESNGLAERQNRTLKDTARTMVRQVNLPSSFWTKAIKAACEIRNRLPHTSLHGISPHQAFFDEEPSLNHFRVFGSIAYIHIPEERRPPQST